MSSKQPQQEAHPEQSLKEDSTNATMTDVTDISDKPPVESALLPGEAQNCIEKASVEHQSEARTSELAPDPVVPSDSMAVDSVTETDQSRPWESTTFVEDKAMADSVPQESVAEQDHVALQTSNSETTHNAVPLASTEAENGVAAPVEEIKSSEDQSSQPNQYDQAVLSEAPAAHSAAAPKSSENPGPALEVDVDDDAKGDLERYHSNKRPESLLTSPLTHPNGTEMFPSLSTAEQDDLAREALDQAQESIVAESSNWSATDEVSDGGYDSDGFSAASTSAESSVRDYLYENGRRYHAFRDGHYNFPNDDVEQEREDMKHAMMKLLCSRKLHFAPIGDNPQQILDIGTGTGIWSIEMGDQFPSAQILGVDLSPIQPDWLPPNVKFLVDDVESPWLHPRNHFDYIHSRHTVMAIKDWMRLFRRSLEHLKPGGWIELQEIHHCPRSATGDGTVPPEHPVARFWDLVTQGLEVMGVDLNMAAGGKLCKMMEDAGFVNVTEIVLHVPIGIWPKNKVLKAVGVYWRTILLDGLQAIALGPLTRGLQWNRDEVEVFLTSVRQAYHDNAALMYMPLHIIYAQKPEDMS